MKILTTLDSATIEALTLECKSLIPKLTKSKSTYVVGDRQECWFEKGWTLNKEPTVFEAPRQPKFYSLGQQFFAENNSCLFLFYPSGSYIKSHRDHTVSERKVVQVNLGCNVVFTLGDREYYLKNGDVISFDSKQLHQVSAAQEERFVISWRKIKNQYLYSQKQLSLF